MTDLDFPSNHVSVRGLPPVRRRRSVYVKSPDAMRTDLRAIASTRSTSGPRWCRSRYVLFRSAYIQDAAAVIEKAHRVGARVILDVYQAAGTVPMELERARRRLRGRRLGEVAVRRAGCRLSLRAAGPGRDSSQPGIVGWAAHAHPFEFADRRHRTTPTRPSASRAARRTCRRSTRRAPATRSSREIGVPAIREKSLALTRRLMDLAPRRAASGSTRPTSDAERGGVGHHRRAERRTRSPTN